MNFAPAPPAALAVSEAIARIEERRDALDLLADKGMELVERLGAAGATLRASRRQRATAI